MTRKEKQTVEIFPHSKSDRRILSYVPDPTYRRQQTDRRGALGSASDEPIDKKGSYLHINEMVETGQRYHAQFKVKIHTKKRNKKYNRALKVKSADLSVTGILLKISREAARNIIIGQKVTLEFNIPSGTLQEGYESRVKIKAKAIRFTKQKELFPDEEYEYVAFQFEIPLTRYFTKKKWFSEITIASLFMGFIVLLIMLMRVQSIIYFKYDIVLYSYSLLTATYLLSRYLFSAFYRSVPVDSKFTPGVSVIIPCFNEETWIQKTIVSCLNQDYPLDKLEVIVVDDCSNDDSVQRIEEIITALKKERTNFNIKGRLKFIKLEENSGKRIALARGVEVAKHELVTFVDSDSFLHPSAIRNIVQPFRDSKMGGVTGRTDVENKWTNYITKMQAVRYYVAFRIMKAAESVFDAVTCLSGPISCYRKDLVLKYRKAWLNQRFLGHPATFGDDRSMTNFILRHNRTVYQDSAVCSTIVPSKYHVFLRQQMRWKRSWLRESLIAASYMWRKEPFQALSFYAGLIVPVLAPLVVIFNLIIVPFEYNKFPAVFIMGLLLMSFLMSFVYLLLRKSHIWIYGFVFCLFYEVILLWQMPVACVTFWKSTWGTRKTKQDIAEENRLSIKRRANKRRDKRAGTFSNKTVVEEV